MAYCDRDTHSSRCNCIICEREDRRMCGIMSIITLLLIGVLVFVVTRPGPTREEQAQSVVKARKEKVITIKILDKSGLDWEALHKENEREIDIVVLKKKLAKLEQEVAEENKAAEMKAVLLERLFGTEVTK